MVSAKTDHTLRASVAALTFAGLVGGAHEASAEGVDHLKRSHPRVAKAPMPGKARAAAATPAYAHFVRAWHTPVAGKGLPTDPTGRPTLVLASLNTRDSVELVAASDGGGFSAQDLDRAAHVLREPSTGNEHPVEPRVVDLLYRIQSHFAAQEIRVVSGYRTPHGRHASNHGHGRAVDIVVPGAADADVAKFARELGFVGVGIYPASGFVHVDVRNRSYFWVDASAPGRRNRERGILGDTAQKSDAVAAARGEKPVAAFFVASDVDAALRLRAIGSKPAEGGDGATNASGNASGNDDEDDDDTRNPAE